ncbi:unnamed protein product [Peronospora farinosa]|uniref:Ras-GAP domain-containing protein n=1 Tax=Peronospora farinosa TaxID=134698 RepID=A0AAV0U0F6_9STRA|nr:unnamed protein product [Peronospora farinosa]CAI5730107.1 unnamed protein product [Peronospora farinosa]
METKTEEELVVVRPELIQCPELLFTGVELEKRTPLSLLHMKGRRFESPWEPFFVGIYAHSLFYFTNLGDWPCGVVPLFDATVKTVDRIYRHGDIATGGDDCGPCWKLTSSSGRVLLFRASSHDARVEWIEQVRQASIHAGGFRRSSMDGKAALALARRLSRTTSSASSVSTSLQSPRQLEQTEMLRDALRTVEKQRHEIEELQKLLHKCRENGMQMEEGTQEIQEHTGSEEGTEIREMRGNGDMERGVMKEEGGEDRSEMSNVDEEIDIFAILDGTSIEICKDSRASAISDVLSEDDDTLLTEDEDNVEEEDDNEDVQDTGQGDGRNNILSLSLVNELTEACVSHEDGQAGEINPDEEGMCETQSLSPRKKTAMLALKSPEQETTSIMVASRQKPERLNSNASSLSAALIDCHNAAENKSIQQQVAELVEMARNLNKDDATDSSSAHGSSEDGSLTPSRKGLQSGAGIFDSSAGAGNDFLQLQAMELAEIARNLQSSFRADPMPSKVPLKPTLSSSSLVGSQSSFSDVTDFGLNQINSNGSNGSIFSITQDDLYFDEDENGEIERLSEFDASDNQFLEASGFLDSIHQVMKDFIVSTQPDPSRQPDLLVIDDESTAETRQETDASSSKVVDSFKEAYRQRPFRTDSPAAESSNVTSPRMPAIFSHTRSAQDIFNGDIDALSQSPKDLPSLVVEDTMSVVASILQSAGREDKMLLLSPFLRVFGSRNHLSHLIRWAIEIEVASVINVATLFRSDDYASRLVSTYSKAIGSKFIRVALSEPIRQICKLKIADMELNPHKEESLKDEAQADSNAANLMRTCQNIIDSIMTNANYIPSSYFHICSHLNSKVISRFDGSKEGVEAKDASTLTRSVIGGFLFLRFVCPAITTPHLYGLTKQLPPPETRRVLVLVTKLLFKTATGVKFGDREPQFKVLNPFIEKNSPAIQQLFANLAMSPSQDIDECFASDSRKIYSHVSSSQLVEDLEVIRSISEKNLEDIEKKLEECECQPEVLESFKTAVLTSSDPQKSSLTKKLSANMKFLSGFGKKPRTRKQSDQ